MRRVLVCRQVIGTTSERARGRANGNCEAILEHLTDTELVTYTGTGRKQGAK